MKKAWRRLSPPSWTAEALRAYGSHIRAGAWTAGRRVRDFEAWIAGLAGLPPENVVATDTCTNALAAAGEIVLHTPRILRVCPLTYSGTYSWARVQRDWVDCDEEGWPAGPVDVGVELWGRAGESNSIVMDCAHRFRPEEQGSLLRDGGDVQVVCYSFGPMKELPGVRGGAAMFRESSQSAGARSFLNNGLVCGVPSGPGRKGLLANAEAAFLMKQGHSLGEWRRLRQQVLRWYSLYFPQASPVATLMTRPGEASGHLCVLRFPTRGIRDLVRDRLTGAGVETSVHYPVPNGAPEHCVKLSERVLSVPCHPGMRRHDVHKVATRIISV